VVHGTNIQKKYLAPTFLHLTFEIVVENMNPLDNVHANIKGSYYIATILYEFSTNWLQ
jgi:hypothetical protein